MASGWGPRASRSPTSSGRGGQRILVAPALDLIIGTTGGGIDPGDIVDPVTTTLVDPTKVLPPNPAGEAKLSDATAAAGAPPPAEPVAPLPATAVRVSSRTYAFPPNPFGLEARLPGQPWTAVGMNGTVPRERLRKSATKGVVACSLDPALLWIPAVACGGQT